MDNWQEYDNAPEDLVLSSRIRLARNINGIPFPNKLDVASGKEVVNNIEKAFYTSDEMRENYKSIYLWNNDSLQNSKYFEQHLISPDLINHKDAAAFILNKDETISIMLNEEDHIRLQAITGGLNLPECYKMANKLDDKLDENLDFAFDEKLGYITACPTNLGTGMRASAMVHLPALTMNNQMNEILKVLTQVGMTIRGLYGEGTKAQGNLYQISNQITLGYTEEDIITNLEVVVRQVINQEQATRESLIKAYKYDIEDKIYRSIGILKNAVLLNSTECLDLLSNVRMGVELGIIKDVKKGTLNSLIIDTQPSTLQSKLNTKLNEKERDINRARIVKEAFNKV
ncbi:protein arginine kinase [Clostridium oryzae]|uniref:Protein-arginine kinase n=1 Tax=Clostridium oryzae TaxID=1450648 RepID=A0A1V4IMH3_9CLOT|nr:protein arginine kinase [Clostridium oryzae]OPJ61044.1 putative ATP:guanido phosphotransferase [Clostridium oryzae]